MFNSQQLFTEIIPSEEANLSGGYGGYKRNCICNSRHRPEINIETLATANIFGLEEEPSSSIVNTRTDVRITNRGIFARAISLIRIIF